MATRDKKKGTMPEKTVKKKNIKNPPVKGGDSNQKGTGDLISVTIKHHRDNNGGHPHVILEDIEDKHVSVGLSTQKKKGKNGGTNYAMEKSPLDDGKNSYMRRQGTVAPQREYSNKRNGSMTRKDYAQAKVYGERAKQKYLSAKKNKKK